MTPRQVAYRVRTGRLVRLYRGVYAVGHGVLRPEGLRLAAVLACGAGSALSHRSAAAHWGLRATSRARVEVTKPRGSGPGPAGVDVSCARLIAADVTVLHGVPVTTVARTLVDLAAVAPMATVADAVDMAIRQKIYDRRTLQVQLRRGRAGSQALRRVLAERHPERERTRSTLERMMLDVLASRCLPTPEVNAFLLDPGCEVDLLWRAEGLVVELDGWLHHRSRPAFEADRRKTVELQSIGYTVLRFTWRQIEQQPVWVVDRIADQLALCRSRCAQ